MTLCHRSGCDETLIAWLDTRYCGWECRQQDQASPQPPITPIIAATKDYLDHTPGYAGAAAVLVDTGQLAEHHDGQWVVGFDPAGDVEHLVVLPAAVPVADAVRQLGYEPAELGLDTKRFAARSWFTRWIRRHR